MIATRKSGWQDPDDYLILFLPFFAGGLLLIFVITRLLGG